MIIYQKIKDLFSVTKLLIVLLCLPTVAFTQQDTLMKKYIKFKKGAAYNKETGELFTGFGFDLYRDKVIYEGNWIYGLKTGIHKEYSKSSGNWIIKEQTFETSYLEKLDKGSWKGKELNYFSIKKKIEYYHSRSSKEEGMKGSLELYKTVSTNRYRHGVWKKWYSNGQLKSETPYKKMKIDGLYREWYENGQLKEEGMYEERRVTKGGDDGKIGLWKRWYENGQLASEGNYVKIVSSTANGKEDGFWRYLYEDGQLKSESNYIKGKRNGIGTEWYENGQLKTQGHYKNNCVIGLWRKYSSNGQLIWEYNYAENNSEHCYYPFKKGVNYRKDGLCREWTKNGVLIKEINWSNNKEDGLCRKWHKKGAELREEGNYIEGKKDGLWRWRHENGQLSSEVNYINGKYEGIYRSWNRDGKISSEVEYKNGKKQYPK